MDEGRMAEPNQAPNYLALLIERVETVVSRLAEDLRQLTTAHALDAQRLARLDEDHRRALELVEELRRWRAKTEPVVVKLVEDSKARDEGRRRVFLSVLASLAGAGILWLVAKAFAGYVPG